MKKEKDIKPNESVFSDDYSPEESVFSDDCSPNENANEQGTPKNNKARALKYILAFIPLFIVMIGWVIVISLDISGSIGKSADSFNIECTEIESIENSSLAFDMNIANTSKHTATRVDILVSIFDGDELVTTLNLNTKDWLYEKSEQIFTVRFSEYTVGNKAFSQLLTANPEDIEIATEIKEIAFYEPPISMTLAYVALAILTIFIAIITVSSAFVSTFCKNCKTPYALKEIGREELDRNEGNWTERRKIKDDKGREVLSYDVDVSGVIIDYKCKMICTCCGAITYKKDTEKVKDSD